VITLAALDPPEFGDLDPRVGHVAIKEPYTLRVALAAERHQLGVAVVHSHPSGCHTDPSAIDDDMDRYYASYFADFAPGRPYVSLIVAYDPSRDRLSGSGRVWYRGRWHGVTGFTVEGARLPLHTFEVPSVLSPRRRARVARLASEFGLEAAERLAASTVGVLGAGGTGSPALEVLARAGVGHVITVDPDLFSASNLERVHGSTDADTDRELAKVVLARRHIEAINPECRITAIQGALPQEAVIDALVHADVVLGCTDQQHSRLALADLAARYLVPVIDCGVALEGRAGQITGQIVQLTRVLPADPCPYCRGTVNPVRLQQELMSPDERARRRAAAERAGVLDERNNGYWEDLPQLNTVGYLTTAAGAMAAAYAVGLISGRFAPPFSRLQLNLSAAEFDAVEAGGVSRPSCACRRVRGLADQGRADAYVTAPLHWPPPVRI
jgi:molybdopterin/thiamine biosynthesis adenylyltransferase/proteasome lid subunit RPN8/RPN11